MASANAYIGMVQSNERIDESTDPSYEHPARVHHAMPSGT
jgi:hypothetical protein